MFSQTIWDFKARPELKDILENLEERFGGALNVLPSDPEWLYFQVNGLTDLALMRTLESEQTELFGNHLSRIQILSDQTGKERGVSIRCLADAAALDDADPGFWHY